MSLLIERNGSFYKVSLILNNSTAMVYHDVRRVIVNRKEIVLDNNGKAEVKLNGKLNEVRLVRAGEIFEELY